MQRLLDILVERLLRLSGHLLGMSDDRYAQRAPLLDPMEWQKKKEETTSNM